MAETLDDTKLGDYTLLPADDPSLSAEEELEGAFLDPEGDPNVDIEFTPPPPEPYGRTWQFDLAAGRFVRYGDRPVELHGKETLRQWIDFTLNIMATAHSIFPPDYGMEDPFALIGEGYTPAAEADYAEQVEEALLRHDRIVEVGEFVFEHTPDERVQYVEFTVRTDDGEDLTIQEQFET